MKMKQDLGEVINEKKGMKKRIVCLSLRFEQEEEEVVTNYYIYIDQSIL